jgi:hypothetical protein
MNRLAFTGTRRGMTDRQLSIVEGLIEQHRPDIAVHGGCLGADDEFHTLCIRFNIPFVEVFPSNIPTMRALCIGSKYTIVSVAAPQPPLDRNWDIVRKADLLIACPDTELERVRSGTWATVRISSRLDIPCLVVAPTHPRLPKPGETP